MKKLLLSLSILLLTYCSLEGTASGIWWTYTTTEVLETGTMSVGMLDYFTLFNRKGKNEFFAPTFGFEVGAFTYGDYSGEVGFDFVGGTDYPWVFNAKIGVGEDSYFDGSPSMSLGVVQVGTKKGVTDNNVFNFVVGKKIPTCKKTELNVYLGAFHGNPSFGRDRAGYSLGFTYSFLEALDCDKNPYYKWIIVGDYFSGRNALGGGGAGFFYNFTPNVTLGAGPVFFNDASINGKWKWTSEIYISVPLWKAKEDKSTPDDK